MSEGCRDLRVWQEAKALAKDVYLTTEPFRQKRSLGLADQIRRAAVSIPSNIAEGRGRTDRDFSRYLLIARGSLRELQTELEIAHEVGLLDDQDWTRLSHEAAQVGRMLAGMLRVFRHEVSR